MKMFLKFDQFISPPCAHAAPTPPRYWEVVETVRRISFQSALAVIDTPVRRAFFGGMLSVIGVAIYREINPVRGIGSGILSASLWELHLTLSHPRPDPPPTSTNKLRPT